MGLSFRFSPEGFVSSCVFWCEQSCSSLNGQPPNKSAGFEPGSTSGYNTFRVHVYRTLRFYESLFTVLMCTVSVCGDVACIVNVGLQPIHARVICLDVFNVDAREHGGFSGPNFALPCNRRAPPSTVIPCALCCRVFAAAEPLKNKTLSVANSCVMFPVL